jgi:hypothetical protein
VILFYRRSSPSICGNMLLLFGRESARRVEANTNGPQMNADQRR